MNRKGIRQTDMVFRMTRSALISLILSATLSTTRVVGQNASDDDPDRASTHWT